MFNDADELGTIDTPVTDALLLEGVTQFNFTIWTGYSGGLEAESEADSSTYDLTTNRQKVTSADPVFITFDITCSPANPHMADALREKEQRSFSKTIYINTLD